MMHYTHVDTDVTYLKECPDRKFVDLKTGTENWHAFGTYATTLFTDAAVRLVGEHANVKGSPMFLYMAHQVRPARRVFTQKVSSSTTMPPRNRHLSSSVRPWFKTAPTARRDHHARFRVRFG
jgi:hypothetical protein